MSEIVNSQFVVVMTVTMSNDDEDRLARDIREFDRLMSARESHLPETDESRDHAKVAIDAAAKPGVATDVTAHDGGTEFPLPHDKDKSRASLTL